MYPKCNYPIIVQFHEKHEDCFYIANNREEEARIYLTVLNSRRECDLLYGENVHFQDKFKDDNARQGNLFKEGLPKTEGEIVDYILSVANEDTIKAGKMAFNFLSRRKGFEYEDFSRIRPLQLHKFSLTN